MSRITASNRWHLYFTLFLLAVWLTFLFFNAGQPFDEGEHSHVAWLMAKGARTPGVDFFQHHMPLLWDVLSTYYFFGGEGADVVYFGRFFVLICGILLFLGIIFVASQWSGTIADGLARSKLGLLFFVATTIRFSVIFVIRPETISTVAFVWSVYFWLSTTPGSRGRLIRDTISGILFSLAVFASPRFLITAPIYIFLTKDDTRLVILPLKRILTFGVGAAAFVALYIALRGIPLDYYYFALTYSTLLQRIGIGSAGALCRFLALYSAACIVPAILWRFLTITDRRRFLVQAAAVFIIFAISLITAGKYYYEQNFPPSIILVSILLVFLESRTTRQMADNDKMGVQLASMFYFLSMMALIAHIFIARDTIFNVQQKRHEVGMLVKDDNRIIARSTIHPISAEDMSYYAFPMDDSVDRLCEAVRTYDVKKKMPHCDLAAEILTKKPTVIDKVAIKYLPNADREKLLPFLVQHYIDAGSIFLEKDRAKEIAAEQKAAP